MNLQFGLSSAVPSAVTTAWGARWIFPDDVVWDRQSLVAADDAAKAALVEWLNGGAITKARTQAYRASAVHFLEAARAELVILYHDRHGFVVANTNASYGYLYVAAWLHDGTVATRPPAGTPDLTHRFPGQRKRGQRA